jgi:HAD superfamily hydrolase (TIGR01549 family)
MAIRAVLFDVGGPIDTEIEHERLIDQHIVEALAAEGVAVTSGDLEAASEWAVRAFAPSTYAAMIWRLLDGDHQRAVRAYEALHARSDERSAARGGIELREGIAGAIGRLHSRGFALGLAANQPARVIADLDRFGIGKYFTHREVSGHHGFRKPDVRLFLRACEDLGVEPAECIMVGDRVDNDIAPARLLGMRTVLFRTGRHAAQQPRSADEVADVEVWTVGELVIATEAILGEATEDGRV